MGYLAGVIAIAIVIFGWSFWPFGVPVIAALLAADFFIET